MLMEAEYCCGFCGSINYTTVDPSAGMQQEYVEDCQTCCRPNVLRIELDASGEGAVIEAEVEGE